MALYCGASLTQPPGPCGTRRRCRAWRRRGAAGATRAVGRGPRGPRSPRHLACGGRTRPAEQRNGSAQAWSPAPPPPPPRLRSHPHSSPRTAQPEPWSRVCDPLLSRSRIKLDRYFCNSVPLLWVDRRWGDGDGTGQKTELTPGYTDTDVFPPRFTVRPSLRISRFRPRAPGSPPAGRGEALGGPGGQEGRGAG